jgi:hypothetical protein
MLDELPPTFTSTKSPAASGVFARRHAVTADIPARTSD